jgi:YebC/PmpR family DNA-binding regulatory protein
LSGHSKWSTIKRKKGRADAERGRLFTRLIRELTVAAREGGGDFNSNPRLRTAVSTAKAANMPAANIEKAIKRGTGDLPGVVYEEASYEGYGPGGVALLIECLTDNRNRTVADIRHILTKHNGSMGEAGCVSWMFERRGLIVVSRECAVEDDLILAVLEAGAEDVTTEEERYEVLTPFAQIEKVRASLEESGIPVSSSEVTMIPQSEVALDGKAAEHMLKLIDALEEHDDVQKVHANFDISVELMEQLST